MRKKEAVTSPISLARCRHERLRHAISEKRAAITHVCSPARSHYELRMLPWRDITDFRERAVVTPRLILPCRRACSTSFALVTYTLDIKDISRLARKSIHAGALVTRQRLLLAAPVTRTHALEAEN